MNDGVSQYKTLKNHRAPIWYTLKINLLKIMQNKYTKSYKLWFFLLIVVCFNSILRAQNNYNQKYAGEGKQQTVVFFDDFENAILTHNWSLSGSPEWHRVQFIRYPYPIEPYKGNAMVVCQNNRNQFKAEPRMIYGPIRIEEQDVLELSFYYIDSSDQLFFISPWKYLHIYKI